jgi:FkbM family methyltransferase
MITSKMVQLLKRLVRQLAMRFNVVLADACHIGIYLENDLVRLTTSAPIQTIFDVGANHGQSAMRFSRAFKGSKIYSFEPVKSNYEILHARCSTMPGITTINKGLGKEITRMNIGLSSHPGGHSLLLPESMSQSELIGLTTIDAVMEEYRLEKIDLIKIDVEGYELQVLQGTEAALNSNKIRYIYAECIFDPSDTAPHTLFSDLREYLAKYSFVVFACYHESFDLKSGSAMANVLFANKQMLPERVPRRVGNIG